MRCSVQPFRRNSALQRRTEDLILYLKFEDNFDDSSYYEQQVTGINPNILPDADGTRIEQPLFDKNHFVNEVGMLAGVSKHSAHFRGAHRRQVACFTPPCPPGPLVEGDMVLVSGTGVYSNGPDEDSAAEFDLDGDFTFECWAKFSGVPEGDDENPGATIFDFGNLKFTNTSGFFSMHGPDGQVTDYFDPEHIKAGGAQNITKNFFHYAIQRRGDSLEMWMDHNGSQNEPIVFKLVAEDTYAPG